MRSPLAASSPMIASVVSARRDEEMSRAAAIRPLTWSVE
jgi:hypothetical protein